MSRTLSDIKGRLQSVRQTGQITNAMLLLSTSRLRRELPSMEHRTEYTEKLRCAAARILCSPEAGKLDSPYIASRPTKRALYLVVTGDKGLCGSYNEDVAAEAARTAAEAAEKGVECRFFGFGKVSAAQLKKAGLNVESVFDGSASHPDAAAASVITDRLTEEFLHGTADEINIVCAPYSKNGRVPSCIRLLPLDPEDLRQYDGKEEKTVFEPDIGQVFDTVLKMYCEGTVCSLLMLASLSENAARMDAMRAATDNADEMAAQLESELNAARQLGITNEITEIAATAQAQKKK